ncbi:hypothetical protein [Streptomyces bicolor]|uniref:hypothetical protein n=1 Tax=Streptomyces bicolor TaxID=66874 RepID=UPI000A7645C0|nr:hypothetical protein [Streptomyces bicolor]
MMFLRQIFRIAGAVVVSVVALTVSATAASADEVACVEAQVSVNDEEVNTGLQCLVLPL